MKLYCKKCQKPFAVATGAEPNSSVACPICNESYTVPESHTAPGVVIGDFLIESLLSRGGMGEVFVARQISLDREVALKILQDKFTNDKEYIDGLFYEARAAAKVNHPNVVQAYAVGEEDGIYYFAMELIRGDTFKHIIQKEKVIEQTRALKVIKEIASALDAAWKEQRLVHQDIKPDNIMLDSNGFAKLADLGLARKAGSNDEYAEAGEEVMGTPQYISPEQLTGVPTDVRSDIYSLGATLYQMVTGRFAYLAETVEEMSQKHVEGNLEPPQSVNPQLSDEVNAIIIKMMARNIEERYQEPGELIKDIDNALMASARKVKTPPSLKLKLKTPGAAAPKKAAVPAKPQFTAPKKAAVPVSPAKPVAVPAKPATPSTPPAPAKSAPPVHENKDTEKPSTTPPPPATDKPVDEKKPEQAPATQQSVRSALLAKHQEDKNDDAESEEMDAIIAENKPKRSKKTIKIIAIVIGVLLILLAAATGTIIFCADQPWMPEFGRTMAAEIKIQTSNLIKSALPKKKAAPKVVAPAPKPAIVTRKEYLAKVDELLTDFRNNPNAKEEWLRKFNANIDYILSPVTSEEQRASKPLLNIYNRIDDQLVFAKYRQKEEDKRLAAINKALEDERLAREAEAQRLLEEEQKRKEYDKKLEEERKKYEQDRKVRHAKLDQEIKGRITPLVKGAVEIFRGGSEAKYQAALQECLSYTPPYAETNDEQTLLNFYKNNLNNTRNSVASFQKFMAKVKDLSTTGIMFRLYISGKPQMVGILGIDPDGTLHYKKLDGKPGKVAVSELRDFRFTNQIKNVTKDKNTEFYLLMLAGKPGKNIVGKTQDKAWKALITTFAKEF